MIYEHTLIERFEQMVETNTIDPSLIHELLPEYPDLYKPVKSKLISCIGRHLVYVANVRTENGDRFIKVGYTKNTVKQRLSEYRYEDKIYLEDVIHEEKFPALGTVEFEKKLKTKLEEYNTISENVEAPGKGELFLPKHKEKILKEYNSLKNNYKEMRGVKSAN